MRAATSVLAALTLACAAPAVAQNSSGAFIVRLGRDTTAVERYARHGTHLEGDIVQRSPRTMLRHFVVEFSPQGTFERAEVTLLHPDNPAAAPLQRLIATRAGDSVLLEAHVDTGVVRRAVAVPQDAVPFVGPSSASWVGFQLLAERYRRSRATDSTGVPVYFVGAPRLVTMSVMPLSKDSLWMFDGNDVFHVRADRDGRLRGAAPVSGTQQFSMERVDDANVEALARAFAARDQQGQGLGVLSTRDTVRAGVAGATLWIDYGRPAKRGRVIFGTTVVPWGEVWRTGANAATQFRTDRDLEIQGVTIPAGTYTLWTIPEAQGSWKLLFNRQTGQWGTEHDPARDLAQLDLRTSTLPSVVERFTIGVTPQNGGGTLTLDWDTTRASLTFTVR